MKNSPRPVRGLLPTVAVLGLTTAGLAVGFAPAAQAAAEDPHNRDYQVYVRALGATVDTYDERNYPAGYFYRNDAQPLASYSYSPDYTQASVRSQASAGFSNLGEGGWSGAADVTAEGPGSEVTTGHSASGTKAGLGSYGEAWSRVEANMPADGNATPYGTDILNSSVTSNPYNLEPQPMTGLPGTLDLLDGVTAVTSTASTRFVPIADVENRAAVEVVVNGGTGAYTALNGTVRIEIVKAAAAHSLNSGDANTVAGIEGATINVTGPDGTVQTFEANDGRQELTFEDPGVPGVLLTLALNENTSSLASEGQGAYLSGNTVAGSYTDTETGFQVGKFQIGNVYVQTWAPAGGVNVAPQPDADNDGLTAYEENQFRTSDTNPDFDADGLLDGAEVHTHGTSPDNADTDTDGLSDGAEVNVHGTDPLAYDTDREGLTDGDEVNVYATNPNVADTDRDGLNDFQEVSGTRTNPNVADTDRDGLKDGVEIYGFTNKRYGKTFRSSPLKADTDRDGLSDKTEVTGARNITFRNEPTSPTRKNTDGDGYTDLREIKAQSNPNKKRSTPRRP